MVIMDYRDLLTEVSIFLRVTLAGEKLSDHAELCRQQLIKRLITREGSPPQAYIDMNGSTNCPKIEHQISDCYEEFDSCFDGYKSKSQIAEGYVNNLYNNLSTVSKENTYANNENDIGTYINLKQSENEDNMYINPSSPLANTPVIPKPSPLKTPSNSNSERNSIISLKKDTDRTSDTSSFTSSSTRGDESAEVVALSASALRYAASKCGVLGRRERFLFVDHTKEYWVAVVQQSLFMYSTDKDNKPHAVIDIAGYQARPVAVSNNKTDFKFELVAPGKKTYQFLAEKQSDMEKWIGAINAAAKLEETPRQLPPPPTTVPQETYDQPDSVIRPVIQEAEYELPDAVLRSCTFSDNRHKKLSMDAGDVSRHGSEPRQLPPPPQQTYDSPGPGARPVPEVYECVTEEIYHCIDNHQEPHAPAKPKKPLRRLPSLPQEEETYDQPDSTIRPVAQEEVVVQEEFYSVIDNQTRPVTFQEAVYKNTEINSWNEDEDNNYYNLVPSYPEKEKEQECIYNVITEQRLMPTPSPNNKAKIPTENEVKKPPISAKPLFINQQTGRGDTPKREDKRLSPFVSNMATIFNKPSNKPQLREVKPPIINKTS